MRHTWLLLLTFVAALLFWAVWYLPASVVAGYAVPRLNEQGIAIELDRVQGTSWNGSADWRWQNWQGNVSWRLAWQGIKPALDLTLNSGEATLSGLVSGGSRSFDVRDGRFSAPLPMFLAGQSELSVAGVVSGRITQVQWADGQVKALDGRLFYEGGAGRWQQQSAQLPALFARLYLQQDMAIADILDEADTALAKVTLDKGGMGRVEVYRTFAKAVGQSQGSGRDDDVIFKIGQKLF